MIGSYAGWHCRATSRWTLFTCPWSGKQASDCDTPKHSCELVATYTMEKQASERLRHAQTQCAIRDKRSAVESHALREAVEPKPCCDGVTAKRPSLTP